jgi:hypothetical protein
MILKEYIVKLSDDQCDQPNSLIQELKGSARQLQKARILLKADASEVGESWSDGQIAEALDTSIDATALTRQHLVKGGIDAPLIRTHSPNSARSNFGGAAEAKLIALACSSPRDASAGR